MSKGLFSHIEELLRSNLSALEANYSSNFAAKIINLLQGGITILILYYGYAILSGRTDKSVAEMAYNLGRICVIFAFVENSSGLLNLTLGFIDDLKTGFTGKESIWLLLDQQFEMAQQLAANVFMVDTDMIKLRGAIASLMIWLGTILILVSGSVVFIASEVSLTLLGVGSPIFIACLTYGFLKELFNGRLRNLLSCVITIIFASLIIRVGIQISNNMLAQLALGAIQNSLLTIGATALIAGLIVSSLILIASKMAGNIASVATSSTIQGSFMSLSNPVVSRIMPQAIANSNSLAPAAQRNLRSQQMLSKEQQNSRLASGSIKAAIARIRQQ